MVESLERKQREDLAAPILGLFQRCERLEKLGYGEAVRMGVDYLHEVETCQAPAHFKSKWITPETVAKLRAHSEELAKNPRSKRTPMEAVVDLDGVEIDNLKAQLAPGVPPARWDNVKGRTVRNSPVLSSAEAK
jgi:hypothetical protein